MPSRPDSHASLPEPTERDELLSEHPAEYREGERPRRPPLPREIGGQKGPEPTRYGDWEKAGRCTDF
jgi:hypothetical protein